MKKNTIAQVRTNSETSIAKREKYQGIIGFIIFLIVEIRPYATFTTLIASSFAKNPSHNHIKVVKIILQYIKGSKD